VSDRAAALLLTGPPATAACPEGTDRDTFARALAEDVADMLGELSAVDTFVAASPERAEEARSVAWPHTEVLVLPAGSGPAAVFDVLAARGYSVGAVVAPDAPDLPGLLVAKPFSALGTRDVAAAPAIGGGLVVLASRLPAPAWLVDSGVDLDVPDAVERLRGAAPRRRDVVATPGWRRLRAPGDVAILDDGLEGWESTRALLRA
jgi:hypothetical protein